MSARISAAAPAQPGARVAVLARQGKFLVAEPFFGPGPRVAVSRDPKVAVGDLVLLRGAGGGAERDGGGARGAAGA
ncbi:MAG: hypothetical protein ACRDL5_17725, partial [Solirubrobacteraceae bacterium]